MSSELEQRSQSFRENYQKIIGEVAKAIVGQEEVVRQTVVALLAGGHVLLEGVPGLGKTFLVRMLAQAIHVKFGRVQFTPDLMPADIVGTNLVVEDPNGHKRFEFQPGPIFTQILLADEINRATPKTQSALLEAMQERSLTVAGETRQLMRPFFVLATQNPIEMEGTYPLPEAQLDRFLLKVLVPYPSLEDLLVISERTTGAKTPEPETTVTAETIEEMQMLAREVAVAPHVERFAARLVLSTHPDQPEATDAVRQYARYGASPRGMQGLILAGKVLALIDGRVHVSFDDITDAARPVLRHRMLLNFEGEAEGIQPDDLLNELLEKLPREATAVAG